MLRKKAKPASPIAFALTNPPDEVPRDHAREPADDALLQRWMELGEAVLRQGAPTAQHISEMTALARSQQEIIKKRLRRTAKVFTQGQSKH
jgi:hypothetical protein